jgi:copper chaperone CopZ
MFSRYLQIGIIAVAVLLLATAFITARTGSNTQSVEPLITEISNDQTDSTPIASANETTVEASEEEAATGSLAAKIRNSDPEQTANSSITVGESFSKAVLDVQGMSCSGCINEIKSSLAGVEGTGNVLVDLSAGRVEVYYESAKLSDIDKIAAAITAVGYPATLKHTLNSAELEKEKSYFDSRSKLYIAAVGDWEISREDYETELFHVKNRYENTYGMDVFDGERGNALMERLKSQVVSRLITEGVQMQEIRKTGFKTSSETVRLEMDKFLKKKGMTMEQFKQALDENGYEYDYFIKKFENQVTINRYVEDKVISGIRNDREKRQLYNDWYNNARLLAEVVYYDKQLESAVKNNSGGSGCGSSCRSRKKS